MRGVTPRRRGATASSTRPRQRSLGLPTDPPGVRAPLGAGLRLFSSRASIQPPFATLPVTRHVRLSPKILRHSRRNQTVQHGPHFSSSCCASSCSQQNGSGSGPGRVTRCLGPYADSGKKQPTRVHIFMQNNATSECRRARAPAAAEQKMCTTLVHACDAEAPAQSMRSQGAHWRGLPDPKPYIYLRLLSHESAPQTAEPDGAVWPSSVQLVQSRQREGRRRAPVPFWLKPFWLKPFSLKPFSLNWL